MHFHYKNEKAYASSVFLALRSYISRIILNMCYNPAPQFFVCSQ